MNKAFYSLFSEEEKNVKKHQSIFFLVKGGLGGVALRQGGYEKKVP